MKKSRRKGRQISKYPLLGKFWKKLCTQWLTALPEINWAERVLTEIVCGRSLFHFVEKIPDKVTILYLVKDFWRGAKWKWVQCLWHVRASEKGWEIVSKNDNYHGTFARRLRIDCKTFYFFLMMFQRPFYQIWGKLLLFSFWFDYCIFKFSASLSSNTTKSCTKRQNAFRRSSRLQYSMYMLWTVLNVARHSDGVQSRHPLY